jgi:hypothetical protein
MEGLDRLLLAQMPGVCPRCVALWTLLAHRAPRTLIAETAARILGYSSRHAFMRWLGKHGYPAFLDLADRSRALACVYAWELRRTPLIRQAWKQGVDPSVLQRTILRASGENWEEQRRRGIEYWLGVFHLDVRGWAACLRDSLEPFA